MMSIAKKYASHYAGLPLSCWQRVGLSFINDTAGGVCFFLSLYYFDVLHFDVETVGLIASSYGVGTAIGGIMGGKLSDKISPGMVSVVCMFIKSAALLLFIKLNTLPLLMINQFILGVTTYGFVTANKVWVLNHCKDQEGIKLKVLSMLYASSNLGLGLSAVLVSLMAAYGFKYIFLLSGALLFCFSCYFLLKESKGSLFEKKMPIKSETPDSVAVFERKSRKIIWLVLGCLFLIGLIIAQLGTTYSIYVKNAYPHLGIQAVSILFTLNSILIVLFQTPIVNFFSKYNKLLIVGLGVFLMGFSMTVLSFSFVFSLAIVSCVLYTIGEMLFFSTAQLVIYEQGAQEKKGQSLGAFQTVYATSVIVGPILGGYIFEHFSGDMLWYASGVIGIVCLLMCNRYKKRVTI